MRILDQNNNEIANPNLEKGHLEIEQIVTNHHDAVSASPGKSHIEVVKKYPNGGQDVITVWDEEPVEAKDAWDEKETIQRYIPYTEDELKERAEQVEAERKAELTPTNSDLSDGAVDLAQWVSDLGDGVTDLADLVAQLDERLSKLEGGN
jgi:NTP pyrophosphatase (non-canonical NTP hydrolase)